MQTIAKTSIGKNLTLIDEARSDCGRVAYLPHGMVALNAVLLIDGRGVYCRQYVDGDREVVDDATWAIAWPIMNAVDKHNQATLDAARDAQFAREDERTERLEKALRGTRGTIFDPNTY